MATVPTTSTSVVIITPTPHRRRKLIGRRRQIEDEAEDGPGVEDVDDDSVSEGSVPSDVHDLGPDSDTSDIDENSPTSLDPTKKAIALSTAKPITDTERMLQGLSILDNHANVLDMKELDFDEIEATIGAPGAHSPAVSVVVPVVISSSSATQPDIGYIADRRRREHEAYKKRRDEDPAFVPNRGGFFMHDFRSGNGSVPRLSSKGRGRGRGSSVGGFVPLSHSSLQHSADTAVSSQWSHDLHESVSGPSPRNYHQNHPRPTSQLRREEPSPVSGPFGFAVIPRAPQSRSHIDRTMSFSRDIGKLNVPVWLPGMSEARTFSGLLLRLHTRLPDHRPPLRRDKPVRISLPGSPQRFIFPSDDRSFIFIPRALRPNHQQRTSSRRPRSGLGSWGGHSRRTSLFGGSYHDGSIRSPSIVMSSRSSLAPDARGQFSPAGSVVSRLGVDSIPPQVALIRPVPVVRLPPSSQDVNGVQPTALPTVYGNASAPNVAAPGVLEGFPRTHASMLAPVHPPGQSPQQLPQPQPIVFSHNLQQQQLLLQEPGPRENRSTSLPMHQPRPQKLVSVVDIESPTFSSNQPPYLEPFHLQVPVQIVRSESSLALSTRLPHQTQPSTGTPLPQIPERAIYAAPFQPNPHGVYAVASAAAASAAAEAAAQQSYVYSHTIHPYFYVAASPYSSPAIGPDLAPASRFVSGSQFDPNAGMTLRSSTTNLVAHEMNGMVYYYDSHRIPTLGPYQSPQSYHPSPGYGALPGMSDVSGLGMMASASMPPPSGGPTAYFYPQMAHSHSPHLQSHLHSQTMHPLAHAHVGPQSMIYYPQ